MATPSPASTVATERHDGLVMSQRCEVTAGGGGAPWGDVTRRGDITSPGDTPRVTPPPMAAPPPPALAPEQQRAADIIRLLSLYRPLLDASVVDFFAEGLWAQLPPHWQLALGSAPPPALARLLLGGGGGGGAAWPLSLLAFAAAARALAFPRGRAGAAPRPPPQSPRLHPLLRRHVKPKKQHEIRRLGKLLQRLSQATGCDRVVDVGAGQGHLSRFLAFGLGLSVTAVEGDARLVAMAERFDRELLHELAKRGVPPNGEPPRNHRPPPPLTPRGPRHVPGRLDPAAPWGEFLLPPEPPGPGAAAPNPLCGAALVTGLHACGDLSAALLRHFARSPAVPAVASVGCCYMKLRSGYPLSAAVTALPGHALSYRALESACHALEDFAGRLGTGGASLRVHCYRAALESLIRAADPARRRPRVQTVRKAHDLSFPQYARLGLRRVGLDPGAVPLDSADVGAMLEQQHKVVAFLSLVLLLAPVVETLILLDRLLYLREHGLHCALVPLFDPRFSPRNLVLVAARTPLGAVLEGLDDDEDDDGDSGEDNETAGTEPPGERQSPPAPGAGGEPQ